MKIFAWTFGAIAGILLLVAIAVQIPPVQNYIIDKITKGVSEKTGTKVLVGRIGISFPKTVFLEDVFLDDPEHDTLVSAGRLDVNVDLLGLLSNRLTVNSFSAEKLVANISRSSDSTFNFDFLTDALAGDESAEKPADTSGEGMSISVGDIRLADIRLNYNDAISGMSAAVSVGEFDIGIDEFDIDRMFFGIEEISLSNSSISYEQKFIIPPDTTPPGQTPEVMISEIKLENVAINYSTPSQSISGKIGELNIDADKTSLARQEFHLSSFTLNYSSLAFVMQAPDSTIKQVTDTAAAGESNLTLFAETIRMSGNEFSMSDESKPDTAKGFDPSHFHFTEFGLKANNVDIGRPAMTAEIEGMSVKESKGFELTNFSALFFRNASTTRLEELEIRTPHSYIGNFISVSLPENNQTADIEMDVRLNDTYIGKKDLDLLGISSPVAADETIFITTDLQGRVSDLQINKLLLAAGSLTHLSLIGNITGLPDVSKTNFDVEIPEFNTTSADLQRLLPPNSLPENITLPDDIRISAGFSGTMKQFDASFDLNSTFGNAVALMENGEYFDLQLQLTDLDAGRLVSDSSIGKITLQASARGTGLGTDSLSAVIDALVPKAEFKGYAYSELAIDGSIANQRFDGHVAMNDSNLAFDFDGFLDFRKGSEKFAFTFDLHGAALKNLNLHEEDIRLSAKMNADIAGSTMDNFNGTAGILNLTVIRDERTYTIDSLLFASVNEKDKSSFNFSSAIISAAFEGTFVPGQLGNVVKHEIDRHFNLVSNPETPGKKQDFTFNVEIKNHPVLSELLLPELTDFIPVSINGKLDSENGLMELSAVVPRVVYGTTTVDSLRISLNSTNEKITFALNAGELATPSVKLINTSLTSDATGDTAGIRLNILGPEEETKLGMNAGVKAHNDGTYSFSIKPGGFILNDEQWQVNENNNILLSDKSPYFSDFIMRNENQMMALISGKSEGDTTLELAFQNFQLVNLSSMLEKDTALVRGELHGSTLLRFGKDALVFTSDLNIRDLVYREIPVGNIHLRAKNPELTKYELTLSLSGNDNLMTVDGYFDASPGGQALSFKIDIDSLSMETLSAFSNGQLTNASGNLHGDVNVSGTTGKPEIAGELNFSESEFTATAINNHFLLKDEKLRVDHNGIYFDEFTLTDTLGHNAVVDGEVRMKESGLEFDLDINADEFLVLNTDIKDNKNYFGKILLDSRIRVTGDQHLPRIAMNAELLEGSSFTFAIPETKYTTDRGEGVVVFTDPQQKLNPILTRPADEEEVTSEIRGVDLTANLETSNNSTLRILIDPVSGDSLVISGDAVLSFAMDPSGKISLTGTYVVSEGKYRVSLRNLIRKEFQIDNGSTITWNGDPMDADINIDAIYEIKTSPIDLVSGQISGLGETEQNKYRQRLPFHVILHMKGKLLKPDLSFEIDMPPEDRGALGGSVYARLMQINNEPSELNKQVFSLLVLSRFMQEDPLASAGGDGGMDALARTSVSKFLSQQLNNLTDRYIQGVELNFDLQSYDDYSSGTAEGRTELAIGLKKEFFDDRVSVSIGGSVDVEGEERRRQNNASDLTGDVTVEYKLTENGRYRLKAFRHNQYESVIEGEISETGVGLIYTRDFDLWKNLFENTEEDERVIIPLSAD